MHSLKQFFGLLVVNVAGTLERLGSALTIVIGVTCAVAVLVSMLAIGVGARKEELGNARADRVVFSSTGAQGFQSSIPRDEAATASELAGIKKDAAGRPIVSFNAFVPMEAYRRDTGVRTFFPMVGTTTNTAELSPELHLTAGRMFRPGMHELIASNACLREFTGFRLGEKRSIRAIDWPIVGLFDVATHNCMVLTDVETLLTTFGRNSYNRVTAMLDSPAAFGTVRNALQADPTLHLEVKSEREETESDFKELNALLNFVAYFVGSIMAVGATLGAVNSLYAIVDSRRRELATLRAIGFRGLPIGASVICESMLLALPGAVLGGALAWILFNGMAASPFGFSFQLAVTPHLALLGVVWALAMGLIGGVLPALRAGRVSVTAALRAT
ncbi:MAG: ABC transporter permease [Alphaproteobacteria bacterium]|nr:ABC transporter permease [Alphaproteobacteria bacterium]